MRHPARPASPSPLQSGIVVLALLLLFVALLAAAASAQPGHPGPGDWGDAPEGALAYPSIGVVGLFPSCFGGPAGFIWHGNPGPPVDMYWGFTVDDELDGNAGICPPPPYEMDECWGPFDGDGGLAIPDTHTINAGLVVPCGQQPPRALGTTCQVLNLVPGGPLEANIVNNSGVPGYVNVLIDWDQSGTWGGQSLCAGAPTPEHVIQNLPVPPFYAGPLSGLAPGPVQVGPRDGYVWMRLTLGEQPVQAGWDGSGLFDLGETEDYLVRIDPTTVGELGDAPEGALAYPGVMGNFPTCIAVGPGSYVYHAPVSEAFFGPDLDWEGDGNANVCPPPAYDQDECDNNGVDGGILMPAPLTLTAAGTLTTCPTGNVGPALVGCLPARWGVDIDIEVTNNSPADRFVNVLADWNGNGSWGPNGQVCPDGVSPVEHVLVDFVVPAGFSGPLSTLSPPDFKVGIPADGLSWFRFTISDLTVASGWDGAGQFGSGETEDYLFRVAPAPVDAPELALDGAGSGLRLDSVRPNPTASVATVQLATARAGELDVRVYDAAGRMVTALYRGPVDAGAHAFVWDGRGATGAEVTPG
ncbi:MAG TPA: FlgD immunoglobulin-like domain containing protein, partial [bacterium]|nr:FlgD immunoglobulin-like domain containing protein [bacterium]